MMEHVLIPRARIQALKAAAKEIERRAECKIIVERNSVIIDGDSYNEYNAKNIVQAMGRGFRLGTALRLLNEEYFFENIDLGDITANKEKVKRIKARVIGREGKTKLYIESVSGAVMEVYGDNVSLIGGINEIRIAKAGINILIDGGKHSTAYMVMEKERRKLRNE